MDYKINLDSGLWSWLTPLILGVLLFLLFLNPTFIVSPGERAIVQNRFLGMKKEIYGEGIHFKTPVLDRVFYYTIRKQRYEIPETEAASKDLQSVFVKLTFLYNPIPNKLVEIKRTLGQEPYYVDEVFPSIPVSIIKSVIATHTAQEIISHRKEVILEIKEQLESKMQAYHIVIQEVALSDIRFSEEFSAAIEKKQIAEQDLEASKKQAQAAIERARGEAESARIINEASQESPAFIELRRIEAQKDIAKTLAKSNNITYLPAKTIMMMPGK